MFRTDDIYSLSDFVRNARAHVERMRESGRPSVLTLNGSAEVVVQSAAAYQDLLDRLDEMETLLALDEAAAQIERGEGIPAAEGMRRLRERLGAVRPTS